MSFGGRLNRILDLVRGPGLIPSGLVGQSDGELILKEEFARDTLARWENNRDGCGSVSRIKHPLFKFQTAITPGYAGQIAGRRMASRAGPSAIEILFARLDIAGLKIADRDTATPARL